MQGGGRPQSIWLMVYPRDIPGRIKVGTGDGGEGLVFGLSTRVSRHTVSPYLLQCCVTGEARRASGVVRI